MCVVLIAELAAVGPIGEHAILYAIYYDELE